MKDLEKKGIVKVDTDDVGNQFLKLPWIPDRKFPYKSLSLGQRLQNEVCAGAFGEISKDLLLHAVDTAKTRRQAQKKNAADVAADSVADPPTPSVPAGLSLASAVSKVKDLYSGFPVVMVSSIPQGGMFFFFKKSMVELLAFAGPTVPAVVSATVPIGLGAMAYWAIRTPAEVIKSQVQMGQAPNVREAFETAKISNPSGVWGLWKHYRVMLWLDIPFQIINFILYGLVSDAVGGAGFAPSILTRLFCGVTCGMASAAVTCPIDVCKTRIISRDKKQQQAYLASVAAAAAAAGAAAATGMGAGAGAVIDVESELAPAAYGGGNGVSSGGSTDDAALRPLGALGGRRRPEEENADGTVLLAMPADAGADADAQLTESSAVVAAPALTPAPAPPTSLPEESNNDVVKELFKIAREEGVATLFLGIRQRLLYVGLANGIRLAAYGTSRMDLMMRSLDEL